MEANKQECFYRAHGDGDIKMKLFQICVSLVVTIIAGSVCAANLNLTNVPLYLGASVKPNVMLMLDNSGSMKEHMFDTGFGEVKTSYNNSSSYFGIFDETTTYRYDASIPVNPDAYDGTSDAAYTVTVDTSKTGAFYQSTCSPATDADCWSGNYLNWLTTRRIDATRAVLIGGKLESRTPYNYGTISGTTYNYKVLAQNEPDDRNWSARISNSSLFTPIPDGLLHQVFSPAHENRGTVQTTYDPYAKIRITENAIFNSAGVQIGEVGTANADERFVTVGFSDYTNPVVVANPSTFNGGDPGTVAIRNVDGVSDSFEVAFFEWEYRDGGHAFEDIGYIVLEAGTHTLPGGATIVAGTHNTNTHFSRVNGPCNVSGAFTSTIAAAFDTVSLPTTAFSVAPVVLASVTTVNNDTTPDDINTLPVSVRIAPGTPADNEFLVALQQEEALADNTPNSETISYIAIEPTPTPIVDTTNNWTMLVGTQTGVTHSDSTFNFGGVFTNTPTFIANTITSNNTDPIAVRLKSLAANSVTLDVQEEQSCDSEQNHSGGETVGYFAFEHPSVELNVAIVEENEPIGLLQDISSDVRLGVSFYRFPTAGPHGTWGIYNGVTTDGGTLEFKIPNNPFVSFPDVNGGYRDLSGYITTPIDEVIDAVEHYPLVWGTTPLAENLWEVIQYFEQDDPEPNFTATGVPAPFVKADSSNPTRDPYYYSSVGQKLWCAKSSVILFTDGEPFRDDASPSTILDYDGDANSADGQEHGDDLDDVAYWGFCDTSSGGGSCVGEPKGTRDLRSDISGGTDDPGQYLQVHAVRFAGSSLNQIMIDTAANAGGNAYFAADGAQLETALTEAFQAAAIESSAASVALNSGSIGSDSRIYQGRFDSGDWTGELLAFPINRDPVTGEVTVGSELWDAADLMPSSTSRKIITYDGTDAVPFQIADISNAMKAQLGPTLTEQTDVLNYLRGDQSLELDQPGGKYRTRETVLGDLVNSPPALLSPPSARYPDYWGTGAAENAKPYSAFKAANSSRNELILVGGNDGMLHAFNTSGVEQFAYIPNTVFGKLSELTNNSYNHQYYVDGTSNILDAFFDNNWNTVLVSGLGAGGQAMFALDLTNSSSSSFNTETAAAGKFLWEFSDLNDQDLGYTFSLPSIVRLNSGVSSSSNRWAAVFGNGYNNTEDNAGDGASSDSTTGNAVLYIIDIEDGSIIKKFDTGVGTADDPTGGNRPNGLSSPAVVDTNSDRIADIIYAGDLFGNVWKIDVSSDDISNWDFAYKSGSSPLPLYSACAANTCSAPTSDAQAITTLPQVKQHPVSSGYIVYFGTGKYIETTDNVGTGQTTQTYYAIWDKGGSTLTSFDRSDLLEQEIIDEGVVSGFDYRVTSTNSIDWNTHMGWYMDLIVKGSSSNDGERQVTNSILRNGRIIFTTLIPDDDACGNGGTGWLMELDQYSGERLPQSPFDVNGDGIFTADDFVTIDDNGTEIQVAISGTKPNPGGIPTTPSIATDPETGTEYKFTSGSSGSIGVTAENPGVGVGGRQSWRQLEF